MVQCSTRQEEGWMGSHSPPQRTQVPTVMLEGLCLHSAEHRLFLCAQQRDLLAAEHSRALDRLCSEAAMCIPSIARDELCILSRGCIYHVRSPTPSDPPADYAVGNTESCCSTESMRSVFHATVCVHKPARHCRAGTQTESPTVNNSVCIYSSVTCRYAIPYATFIDIRRKDYWATMSHHWVTLLLITFSYAMGFNKVGLVIMLLHDVADPFLELAKLGNYVSPPQKGFTNAFFGIFTFLWISMRVVYFPLWVIYSVLFNAVEEVAGDADPTRFMWVWYGFSSLLILLFLLHLFWTYTILKIALLAVSNGSGAKDSREDDTEGRLTSR